MAKLNNGDREVREAYRTSRPKQFGNLHERMRYAMALMVVQKDSIPNDLWQAMFDLETEVQYHVPGNPPFGRRAADVTKDSLPDPDRNVPADSSGMPGGSPVGSGSDLITAEWLDERFRYSGAGHRKLWFVHSVVAIGQAETHGQKMVWVPRIITSGVAFASVRTHADVDLLCKVIGD